MRRLLVGSLLCLSTTASMAFAADPKLDTDDQKTLYALGIILSQNLSPFQLTEAELAAVQAGLADDRAGRPLGGLCRLHGRGVVARTRPGARVPGPPGDRVRR